MNTLHFSNLKQHRTHWAISATIRLYNSSSMYTTWRLVAYPIWATRAYLGKDGSGRTVGLIRPRGYKPPGRSLRYSFIDLKVQILTSNIFGKSSLALILSVQDGGTVRITNKFLIGSDLVQCFLGCKKRCLRLCHLDWVFII